MNDYRTFKYTAADHKEQAVKLELETPDLSYVEFGPIFGELKLKKCKVVREVPKEEYLNEIK